MTIIDITRNLQDAPIYPGSPVAVVERVMDMKTGAPYNASLITALSHLGTHADAFAHFLPDSNAKTIDLMDLSLYCGECTVVSVPSDALISVDDLKGKIDNVQKLVIHGGGKSYFNHASAEYIVSKGIRTIVTDAWSVAPLDNEQQIHEILLGAGIAIVENVVLDHVADGDYNLYAFPIKIKGCDGSPVRAVLIND